MDEHKIQTGMHYGVSVSADGVMDSDGLRIQNRPLSRVASRPNPAKLIAKRKKRHFGRHGGKQDIGTVLERRRLVRQIIERRGALITLTEVVQMLPERLRCNPCTISRDLSAMRIHHLRKGPLSTADRERIAQLRAMQDSGIDPLLKDGSNEDCNREASSGDNQSAVLANCFSLDRLEPPSMVVTSTRSGAYALPGSWDSIMPAGSPSTSFPNANASPASVAASIMQGRLTMGPSFCETPQSTAESASTSATSPKAAPVVSTLLIFMPGEDVPIRLTRCSRSPLTFSEFKRLVPKRSSAAQYRYFFKTHCNDIEDTPVVFEELPYFGEDFSENQMIVPLWNNVVYARLEHFE